MGNASTSSLTAIKMETPNIANAEKPPEEKKLSPCCVCKETKRERDTCIMENGQENCTSLIEAHKECMRKMGFNI